MQGRRIQTAVSGSPLPAYIVLRGYPLPAAPSAAATRTPGKELCHALLSNRVPIPDLRLSLIHILHLCHRPEAGSGGTEVGRPAGPGALGAGQPGLSERPGQFSAQADGAHRHRPHRHPRGPKGCLLYTSRRQSSGHCGAASCSTAVTPGAYCGKPEPEGAQRQPRVRR